MLILLIPVLLTPFMIEFKFHRIAGYGAISMKPEDIPQSYWTTEINYYVILLQVSLLVLYVIVRSILAEIRRADNALLCGDLQQSKD